MFHPDNLLVRALVKYFNILMAFLLWLMCCIPLVSIGAGTTAYFAVLMRLARENEDIAVLRCFWDSFRENWKQASVIWLAGLLVAIVAGADLFFYRNIYTEQSLLRSSLLVALLVLCGLGAAVGLYIFPVLARFRVTCGQALRNAFVMSMRCLPATILLAGMLFTCVMLLYKLEMFAPFLIAVVLYAMAIIFARLFAPYDGSER